VQQPQTAEGDSCECRINHPPPPVFMSSFVGSSLNPNSWGQLGSVQFRVCADLARSGLCVLYLPEAAAYVEPGVFPHEVCAG
jgi:hypothetical protein